TARRRARGSFAPRSPSTFRSQARARKTSACAWRSRSRWRSPRTAPVLAQRFQPDADLAGGDIGLVEQLANGEEAMDLAGEEAIGDGNAGRLQPLRISIAFVAQGIGAGDQHIG